jgi:hypothetical protein
MVTLQRKRFKNNFFLLGKNLATSLQASTTKCKATANGNNISLILIVDTEESIRKVHSHVLTTSVRRRKMERGRWSGF